MFWISSGKLLWKGQECWRAALQLVEAAERAVQSNSSCADCKQPIIVRRGLLRLATEDKHSSDFRKNAKAANDGDLTRATDGNDAFCITSTRARLLVPGLNIPDDAAALYLPAGHYEAAVICLGAAVASLHEFKARLPLIMCRGKILELRASCASHNSYPPNAPSLLGSTWLAHQGNGEMLLGATKEYGDENTSSSVSPAEAQRASDELLGRFSQIYPQIMSCSVAAVRAGVRALPPRTAFGSLPIAGKLIWPYQHSLAAAEARVEAKPSLWLAGGLGSRGLIYHAWLAECIANAIIHDSESLLPAELCSWDRGKL
eukprot:SM000101S09237  [mRNA]  locus=s101:84525:86478:+ [translate_table: standard]